jgi:scyllo-inositol 2-dehydrogenase (NADP+)
MVLGTSKGIIRVGIAGLGRSGWDIHAALLKTLPEYYRITAVTDPVAGRMEEARAAFGCRMYHTFDEMLADPALDLVVVATPSHLHAENTIAALRSGRAVVCEKPMAATLAEADRMIAAAHETGRPLAIFHNRRYGQDFLKVKEVIASGVLGRIVEVRLSYGTFSRRWDWQTMKKAGGGTLRNAGAHFIDETLALGLIDAAEPEVFCHKDRVLTLGDTEDHLKVMMRAPGSPLIEVDATSACAYPDDLWQVLGSRGTLHGSTTHLSWKYCDVEALAPVTLTEQPTPDRSYPADRIPWHEESWSAENESGWEVFYLDMYKTLREGGPAPITPESVRRVMWVIERCDALANM